MEDWPLTSSTSSARFKGSGSPFWTGKDGPLEVIVYKESEEKKQRHKDGLRRRRRERTR
jgi:hypothetical protein